VRGRVSDYSDRDVEDSSLTHDAIRVRVRLGYSPLKCVTNQSVVGGATSRTCCSLHACSSLLTDCWFHWRRLGARIGRTGLATVATDNIIITDNVITTDNAITDSIIIDIDTCKCN